MSRSFAPLLTPLLLALSLTAHAKKIAPADAAVFHGDGRSMSVRYRPKVGGIIVLLSCRTSSSSGILTLLPSAWRWHSAVGKDGKAAPCAHDVAGTTCLWWTESWPTEDIKVTLTSTNARAIFNAVMCEYDFGHPGGIRLPVPKELQATLP
jgi:hypothetical protein